MNGLGGAAGARRGSVLLMVVAALAGGPATAQAKGGKPDLKVTAVSDAPEEVAEGGRFRIKDTVANTGRDKARESDARYYLTLDPNASLKARRSSRTRPRSALGDLLLTGSRRVPAIKGRDSQRARRGTRVDVPLGTPPGTYHVLACADDRDAVKETREDDNCRASKEPLTVTVAVGSGGSLRVDAFSETRPSLEPEDEQRALDLLRSIACTPIAGKVKPFPGAVRALRGYLTSTAGADAMKALRASPDYKSAERLQTAAGAAVIAGHPGAALAALLRAHDLQPRDASHLVNAAGVATAVGRPHEALALLDRAARLDDGDVPAMGISRQAAALATRGQALVDIGRYGEAERVLTVAQRTEPLLSEAWSALAAAQTCQGKSPGAAYRAGRKRIEKRDPVPSKDQDGPSPLDESLGKESELRTITLPARPDQAPGYVAAARKFVDDEAAAQIARVRRGNELRAALAGEPVLDAHRARRDQLLRWAYIAPLRPDTVQLQRDMFAALNRAEASQAELFGSGQVEGRYGEFMEVASDACAGSRDYEACYTAKMREQCIPAATQTHFSVMGHLEVAYDLARRRHRLATRRMSGVAAHIKSPLAYELVMLEIQQHDASAIALLVQRAHYWSMDLATRRSSDAYHCFGAPEPPDATASGEAEAAGNGPCQGNVKSINLLWSLGPLTFKAGCEELAVEGSTEGWIAAFAEVKYDYRNKTLTVFGGAKGEIGAGPIKGDFKSGIYVRVGESGPQDVGWRVGPSYTVGAGPVEFNPSDTIDMTFIGSSAPVT